MCLVWRLAGCAARRDSFAFDDVRGTSEESADRRGVVTARDPEFTTTAVAAVAHASTIVAIVAGRDLGIASRERKIRQPIVSAPRIRRWRERRSGGSPGSPVSHTEDSAGRGSRTVGTATRRASRRRSGVTAAMSSPSLGGFIVPIPPLASIARAC